MTNSHDGVACTLGPKLGLDGIHQHMRCLQDCLKKHCLSDTCLPQSPSGPYWLTPKPACTHHCEPMLVWSGNLDTWWVTCTYPLGTLNNTPRQLCNDIHA